MLDSLLKLADSLNEILRRAVRPLVTLGFAYAFIILTFQKIVSAEVFVGIVVLVIKYWFDSREEPRNGKTAQPEVKPCGGSDRYFSRVCWPLSWPASCLRLSSDRWWRWNGGYCTGPGDPGSWRLWFPLAWPEQ